MEAAASRLAEKEDREWGIDQEDIFHRMILFLPTLTVRLYSRAMGADDTPFRAVMGTRGDTGTAAGAAAIGADCSASGMTTVVASASETPRRCANAVSEGAGASPTARAAAR